jgi:enediyne biosynthesis protein E4
MFYSLPGKKTSITLMSLFFIFSSCGSINDHGNQALFTFIEANHTKIDFINTVEYTEEFNTYTYRNFYNGAGVGVGDFNGDGLPDLFFCGNLVSNRLYINKGDFVFEDVTDKAGLANGGSWSSGVSIADVNGDGWLDIYICKSGKPDTKNRKNELFINNGDLTFTEKAAEYGLDVLGLSNHATFFDYDRDGDLDCYLLNNSFQSVTEFDIRPGQREIRDSLGANKLYRNDGDHFTDVSVEAGIYSSKIGFGLGVSIGDLNRDGWQDIYVANDFFERDYLYINSGDGTFKESLVDQVRETSLAAMGADISDLNNDGWPEIFVTEMTPENMPRFRTKAYFEDWSRYQMKVRNGYHHQFPRNTLQLNNRNSSFSEIGRYSGVSTTDWSWGALIFDMDNDGWRDIFVANGIYKDLLDRDFLDVYSNPSVMRTMIRTEEKAILQLIGKIPSERIPNYAFRNNHDLTFTNLSEEFGLNKPSWSNGSAFCDLDNDGDLDLVVNNVNMAPFIYRNESDTKNETNYLILELEGRSGNNFATGSCVTVFYDGKINYQELIPCRGFQSTSDNRLHFGLGASEKIDSVTIIWPDGFYSVIYDPEVNTRLHVSEKDVTISEFVKASKPVVPVFRKADNIPVPDFVHRENDFNDFEREKLIFRMVSNEGPALSVADFNGDGLPDLYASNAKDATGGLYLQDGRGGFYSKNTTLFEKDRISEDTDCAVFDADGDGDNDLYVATGGNEFPNSSSALSDRLYLNDGKGNLTRSGQMFPDGKYESNSCVEPADFDNDGDIDLFIGTRLIPFSYGVPATSYLLENDGKGNFRNVTSSKAKSLINIGMVTDMVWEDIDNDNDLDMLIVGEWMPIRILINENGSFRDISTDAGLANTEGFWHTAMARDLNNDGLVDFILGNDGLNAIFRAGSDSPLMMYVNDFDLNGTIEQIICWSDGDNLYPLAMKDDLTLQIPSLRTRYKSHADYRDATIHDIFSIEVLNRSIKLYARVTESCLLINKGEGRFELSPLPPEAQYTPVYAIAAEDFDHDGICDLVLGGNQYRSKPEAGINDAGYGLFLKGRSDFNWIPLLPAESGLFVAGQIRDFEKILIKNKTVLVIALNNNKLQFYEY